jgi:hypothetical protein
LKVSPSSGSMLADPPLLDSNGTTTPK